eukprot:s720_g28.t1
MLKGICGDGIMSPAQLLSEKERQLRTLPRFFQEKLGPGDLVGAAHRAESCDNTDAGAGAAAESSSAGARGAAAESSSEEEVVLSQKVITEDQVKVAGPKSFSDDVGPTFLEVEPNFVGPKFVEVEPNFVGPKFVEADLQEVKDEVPGRKISKYPCRSFFKSVFCNDPSPDFLMIAHVTSISAQATAEPIAGQQQEPVIPDVASCTAFAEPLPDPDPHLQSATVSR